MEIISNGSKWLGEPPDTIETLLEVLGKNTLDPKFGTFVTYKHPGMLRVFGNFLTISHVFNILGTVDEMRPLARAIKMSQCPRPRAGEKGKRP
jgi:hypothetical protein